jgi:hypothetical protein
MIRFAPVSARPEQPQRHEGMGVPVLDPDEQGEKHHAQDQAGQHQRRAPRMRVRGDDAVHQCHQAAGDGKGAGPIQTGPPAIGPRLRDCEARHGQHEHADRDVDEQNPTPGQQIGEHATGNRTGSPACASYRAPQTQRPGAGFGFGEGRGQDRERCRRQHRAGQPLKRSGTDQLTSGLGQAAEE